eukprot:14945339-Alexandrium_andersonii.AAC.1
MQGWQNDTKHDITWCKHAPRSRGQKHMTAHAQCHHFLSNYRKQRNCGREARSSMHKMPRQGACSMRAHKLHEPFHSYQLR